MKISLALCLIIWITITAQICTSQIISNGGNKEITTENGTDILVTEPEDMEVVVLNNNLTFEICTMNCTAEFLVCYEPDPPKQKTTEYVDGVCDPLCGFYVTGDEKIKKSEFFVAYTSPTRRLKRNEKCDIATMSFEKFIIRSTPGGGGGNTYKSCKPKIENGLVKLNVTRASSDCPITIKNAQFKRDPPTTTVLPSSPPSEKSSSSNVFGIFGWIFALLSMIFLQF